MTSPILESMRAVHAALTGDAALMGRVSGVYGRIPEESAFPYVSYFTVDAFEDDAECITSTRMTLQVDIWGRDVSPAPVYEIESEVKRVLHNAPLALTDNAMVFIKWDISRDLPDPDGLTHHRAMTFTIVTEDN